MLYKVLLLISVTFCLIPMNRNTSKTIDGINLTMQDGIILIQKEAINIEQQKLKDQIDQEQFEQQWHEEFEDFEPDDLMEFKMESGSTEILYYPFDKQESIRVAFLSLEQTNSALDFVISSPSKQMVFIATNKKHSLYQFKTQEIGQYQFTITNKNYSPVNVILTIDIQNHINETLNSTSFDPLQNKIKHQEAAISDLYHEIKFSSIKHINHLQEMERTHAWLVGLSILETIAIVAISIYQVYFIKSILENRKLI